MSDNFDEFARDLERESKELPANEVRKQHREIHLAAVRGVVLKTPVDTGRARANWQSSIGSPAAGERAATDKSGQLAIDEGTSVAASIEAFEQSFVTNNVDYIEVLEDGGFVPSDPGPSKDPRGKPGSGRSGDRFGRVLVQGGYSLQAPQGMVAITIEELKQEFPGAFEVE